MAELITVNNWFEKDENGKRIHPEAINFTLPESDKGKVIQLNKEYSKSNLFKYLSGIKTDKEAQFNVNGKIFYVSEDAASLPWFTVKENLELLKKLNHNITDSDIQIAIDKVELTDYENYIPKNVNSGFRYRIMLAQAILIKADIILVEDIFSSLYIQTGNDLKSLISNLSSSEKITFVIK